MTPSTGPESGGGGVIVTIRTSSWMSEAGKPYRRPASSKTKVSRQRVSMTGLPWLDAVRPIPEYAVWLPIGKASNDHPSFHVNARHHRRRVAATFDGNNSQKH